MNPHPPPSPARWAQVKELFYACLDLPEQDRPAFLTASTLDDPALRPLVESMLTHHHSTVRGFEEDPSDTAIPDQIGPYKVVRLVARSLTSLVLQATRQDGQFDQTVAIKILQPAAATPLALMRLESERRILASLNHPSICRLLDSGQLASGQHYLILEWIEGIPFLEAAQSLNLTAKLNLFREICATIEAAHRLLVIHRDLKPAHILITSSGAIKILDFGIAKLLPSLGADDSRLTQYGESPLTPAYASPEQWRGEPASAAMDVFSLGILLAEFLTGQHPFGPSPALPHEWASRITSGTPALPSALPARLRAIAAKAIASRTEDRYPTVEALRQDIENYLDGKPVLARPGNSFQQAALWVRRNRNLSLGAVLVLALSGFEIQQWITRRNAELLRAEAAQQSARQLVLQTFQALAGTNVPAQTRRQILYAAIRQLELWEASAPSPAQRLELVDLYERIAGSLGESFTDNLEDFPQAENCARQAVRLVQSIPSVDPILVVNASVLLADILFSHAKFDEARQVYTLAMAKLQTLPTANSPSNQLYRSMMQSMLGDILLAEGKPLEALPIQQRVLALREHFNRQSGGTLNGQPLGFSLGNVHLSLAQTQAALQQPPAAIHHARQAIAHYRAALPSAPCLRELILTLLLLGDLIRQHAKPAEALQHWREAQLLARDYLAKDPENAQRKRLLADVTSRLQPRPPRTR